MRGSDWAVLGIGAIFVACASSPPPPAPAPTADDHDFPLDEPDAGAPQVVSLDAPERSAPPSTGSYEEALSKPESLDVHDERVHLTDGQLTGPMRGVLSGCRMPSNAHVTIKTAVQKGRAIGVTINVRWDRPTPSSSKPQKPPSRAQLRYEAKVSAKIVTCVDKNVRAITWPPSNRRDSFTTEF